MGVYLDWMKLEAKLDSENWTDISADWVGKTRSTSGIRSNSPLDLVATSGSLDFYLNNSADNSAGLLGYYSPGHTNCRAGFDRGLSVRLSVCYDGIEAYKFQGRVNGIEPTFGEYGERRTHVTAGDWMDSSASGELNSPTLQENKTFAEIVAAIVANMDVQPEATEYTTGGDVYSTVFDTTISTTRAMSEFAKAARSEMGYVYVTHTRTSGEILTVEKRGDRELITEPTDLPIATDQSDKYLLEGGGNILLEGGGDLLIQSTEKAIMDAPYRLRTSWGANQYNKIRVTAYPREISTSSDDVLYVLQEKMELKHGETQEFDISYRDPNEKAVTVAAKEMQAPVANTDYTMNTKSDGTGTDLTANLSITVDYSATGAHYSVTNTHATKTGYITLLQARGRGIYLYDSVDAIATDTAANLAKYGQYPLNLSANYVDSLVRAQTMADYLLAAQKEPYVSIEEIQFVGNRDSKSMMAFLYGEIGKRVNLNESQTGINGDYFINGTEFEVNPGGVVYYTWYVIEPRTTY